MPRPHHIRDGDEQGDGPVALRGGREDRHNGAAPSVTEQAEQSEERVLDMGNLSPSYIMA